MTSAPSAISSLSILIVEDNNFLREILSTALGDVHKVTSAATLANGWELYLENRPNIVFLDIHLPDGSGHELAKRIKDHDPQCFVVMETANENEDNLTQAENNLVNGFISKPFSKTQIQNYVTLYLSHFCKKT